MGRFLGTGTVASFNIEFLPYEEAKQWVNKNYSNCQNAEQWRNIDRNELPMFIPKNPHTVYKDKGWISWGEFLNTGKIQDNILAKTYLSYEETRSWILKKFPNIKISTDWLTIYETEYIPSTIPKHLWNSYKNKGWVDWNYFLYGSKIPDYHEAIKIVHTLKLKNAREWYSFIKNNKQYNYQLFQYCSQLI